MGKGCKSRHLHLNGPRHGHLLALFINQLEVIREEEPGFLFLMNLILSEVVGLVGPLPRTCNHWPEQATGFNQNSSYPIINTSTD